MKILFRTVGGKGKHKEVGLGHIFRCINLAHFLKSNDLYFLLEDYGGAADVLRSRNLTNIFKVIPRISLQNDINETRHLVEKKGIDIVIADKYNLNKNYVRQIRKLVKTVVISDLKEVDFDAHLIVNGFVGYKNKIIKNRFGSRCLLGPSYQILSDKYAMRRNNRIPKYSLLSTFGGFDDQNIMDLLVNPLRKYLSRIKVKLILGPATLKTKKINELELKYPKNLKVIQETRNMAKEISSSIFGLCSGGITTYEFAALGIPFAIICQYRHQLMTAKEWEKRGIAINLGMPNPNTEERIEKIVKSLVEGNIPKIITNKMTIDGLGSKRVAREIIGLACRMS